MDFHQALTARYGVRHFAFGGALGEQVGGLANNPVGGAIVGGSFAGMPGAIAGGLAGSTGDFGGAVSDAWKSAAQPNNFNPNMPTNTFNPTTPTNTFNPTTPVNSYRATAPIIQQTNFQPAEAAGLAQQGAGAAGLGDVFKQQNALAQSSGQTLGQQQNLYGQQQGLADALLAQSKGQGPNPAQLQFQQNVNQNIAQQAGAIASQRGINPALAGRMAAQQGAAMNQQAAGQAGVLQAQQQLGAQQALGAQQQALGANLQGQNATLANSGNLFSQAAGTAGALGGLGSNLYGTGVQGQNAQNQVITQGSLGVQGINAGTAGQNAALAAHTQDLKSGVAQQNAALGAHTQDLLGNVAHDNLTSGIAGQQIKAGVAGSNAATQTQLLGGLINAGGAAASKAGTGGAMAHGGEVHDQQALSLAHALMGRGGDVPGRAKKKGDSSENDTVPTVLSPHEIVIPRSISMADDAPAKAAEFVAKLKGKDGSKSGAKGYGKILEKHRAVKKHMDELEAMLKRGA